MFTLRLILAAGSLSTLISGAPVPSIPSDVTQVTATHFSKVRRSAGTYMTTFGGNGAVAAGWPSQNQWVSSFDTMFADNNDILKSSCAQWNVPNNSDQEISDMASSIKSVAASSGVDARFILAVVMQESNGCVRAPSTNYGVRNPGLMQSHNGAGTCNDATVSTPCPASSITQMIQDGVSGTAAGDGLKQLLALTGASDASQYYIAARMYNSGSVDSSKNLGLGIATHCYSSDIANRLKGWSAGPSSCDPNTVGSLTGTAGGSIPEDNSPDTSIPDTSSPEPVVVPTPVIPAAEPVVSVVIPSPKPAVINGGAFAQVSPTPKAVAEPTVAAPPIDIPTPDRVPSSPVTEPTVIVSPVPAPPVAPSTPAPVTSSVGAVTAGTACTSEGLWNCIGGSSFQQCASGTWSTVQNLAAGMQCTEGQSMVFGTSAIGSKKRALRFAR